MSTVFISYRRQTASGEARALFNDLAAKLGENSVFMDVDSIALGRDFRDILRKTLDSCDIMLVLIDKDWLSVKDEKGRVRLENPADYVRQELEAGLKRDIVLTPILVKGAQMPAPEELPAEIRELAYRNAFELTYNRWQSDFNEMVRRLGLTSPERPVKVEPAPSPSSGIQKPLPMGGAGDREQVGDSGFFSTVTSFVFRHAFPYGWTGRKTYGVLLLVVLLFGGAVAAIVTSSRNLPLDNTKQDIRVWKVGSPHEGDTPDSTPPFDLQKEAKTLGYFLIVKGYPAKGFADKFFDAFEKNEEPDVLAINNYGIINGITTNLGDFTGIGNSKTITDKMIFTHGSLAELEDQRGGWQILFSTSKNHHGAKLLALRQPDCDPKLKLALGDINEALADDLQRNALKYVVESNSFHAQLGSDFKVTICDFWGNNSIAFLKTVVNADQGKAVGWTDILIIMSKTETSWNLESFGGNTNIISELNKTVRLHASPSGNSLGNKLKIVGPADGTKATRIPPPSLEWEWGGEIKNVAVNLVESQAQSNNRWFGNNFTLVQPENKIKLLAPFGLGQQPHRWRVWIIDKNGSIVQSDWSTINFTN
jgi:hypothetical protein